MFNTPGEPLNPPLLKSSKLSEYTIKKRVLDSYEQAYGTDLSDLESTLINPILNYRDVNFNTSHSKQILQETIYFACIEPYFQN